MDTSKDLNKKKKKKRDNKKKKKKSVLKKRKLDELEVDDEIQNAEIAPKKKKKKTNNNNNEEESIGKKKKEKKNKKNKKKSKKEKKKKNKKKKKKGNEENDNEEDLTDIERYRKENEIGVSCAIFKTDTKKEKIEKKKKNFKNEFKPIETFEEGKQYFDSKVMDYLNQKFDKPTPIQSQSWSILDSGVDAIAIALTGSGKTIAFLVPAIKSILQQRNSNPRYNKSPKVLILAPTRELAMQNYDVAKEIGKLYNINSICIYGGVSKYDQIKDLKQNKPEIIIATPGRLLGLFRENKIDLYTINYLILDEADRMLDLGFEPDVTAIINEVSTERQTVMFSATWPLEVQALAKNYLQSEDCLIITIGKQIANKKRNQPEANVSITQIVELVDPKAKNRLLEGLLDKYSTGSNKILVFCLYKKEAARVHNHLKFRLGYSTAQAIHGDMNQFSRTTALSEFKNGSSNILVATDVAARGLDIPDVEYVINYTFPLTVEDYVHRIGRTGRGGKTGTAHTFFTVEEKKLGGSLCRVLENANQYVPPEIKAFGPTYTKRKEHSLYGHFYKKFDDTQPMPSATRVTFDSDSDDE